MRSQRVAIWRDSGGSTSSSRGEASCARIVRRISGSRSLASISAGGSLASVGKGLAQREGIERGAEAQGQPDRASRDLGGERQVVGAGGAHAVHQAAPALGIVAAVGEQEPHRPAAVLGHLAHPAELGGLVLEVGEHAERAAAGAAHRPADGDQLLMLGIAAGHQVAGQRLVLVGAAGGEADGARLQGLLRQPRHGLDILGRRMLAGDGALAHDIDPQGVVGELRRDVDGARQPRQRVEVIREALPVPLEAFGQRDAGDVLHPLHQVDQRLVVLLADGGEAHAAIAEHDGRGAVPGGRREHGIPGGLAVIVRVHIDPARRDDPPVGLDLAPARTCLAADLDDAVAIDGDVARDAQALPCRRR